MRSLENDRTGTEHTSADRFRNQRADLRVTHLLALRRRPTLRSRPSLLRGRVFVRNVVFGHIEKSQVKPIKSKLLSFGLV